MKDLICPLCALPLNENLQGLACANRHQFDRAKEGYFNLLPVHHKNSREPGDAKQQLMARKEFLTAGYFLPLIDALKKIINTNTLSLLDIGCGEGYFTRLLSEHCYNADIYGLDISKAGVRLAAKNNSSKISDSKIAASKINYIVASSHALPIADASMDIIVRIYAPSKDEELFRVLKPDGKLIIVTPGEQHLIALRQKIYQTIKTHPKPKTPEGFVEVSQDSVSFSLDIPGGDLTSSLLEMTPFLWKLTPELLEQSVKNGLVDQAHFQISIYQPVG